MQCCRNLRKKESWQSSKINQDFFNKTREIYSKSCLAKTINLKISLKEFLLWKCLTSSWLLPFYNKKEPPTIKYSLNIIPKKYRNPNYFRKNSWFRKSKRKNWNVAHQLSLVGCWARLGHGSWSFKMAHKAWLTFRSNLSQFWAWTGLGLKAEAVLDLALFLSFWTYYYQYAWVGLHQKRMLIFIIQLIKINDGRLPVLGET